MTLEDQIAVKLGLSTGDFKAALADVNAQVSAFSTQSATGMSGFTDAIHETHSAMRLFHQFLLAGGIFATVKSFYTMAIDYAEKHKEDTDSQTQAVRDFATAVTDAKQPIAALAVQTLGFVNEAGQGWGDMIAAIIYGSKEAANAQAITKSAEQDIADIAAKHAETVKEISTIDKEIVTAEQARAKTAFDQLDTQQKIATLTQQLTDEFAILNSTSAGSLAHETAKLDILKLQDTSLKVLATDKKDQTAEEVKQTAEAEKQEAWAEKLNQSADDAYNKLKFSQLPLDQQVSELQKQRAVLVQAMAGYDKDSVGYKQDYVAVAKIDQQIAADTLTLQKDTTGELQKQTAEAKAQAEADAKDPWKNGSAMSVTGSADYTSMSTAMLQGIIQKQNALLTAPGQFGGEVKDATVNGSYGDWLTAELANQQIRAAQAEIQNRANIQSYVARFGQNAAIMQYGDSAVSNATAAQNTTAQNTLNAVTAVATTLNKLFPDQATPVTATH